MKQSQIRLHTGKMHRTLLIENKTKTKSYGKPASSVPFEAINRVCDRHARLMDNLMAYKYATH